jgi:hypothetical protein
MCVCVRERERVHKDTPLIKEWFKELTRNTINIKSNSIEANND